MLKAAVIGVGSMGKNHARILNGFSDVELVAVSDTNKDNVKQASHKFNCNGYTDYKHMLDEEKIDFVCVAVPTSLHKEVALYVISKNIHLLLEKPIASNTKEGEEIINSAKEKGVKLMIGHIERFNPSIIELRKRLNKGELGRVFKIDVNRVGPFPARIRDVGVVIDLAVHDLDIIRYITGSEVKRVYAETEKKIHSSNEDLLKALIRMEDNTLCSLNVDWLTPTKIRKVYVTGERGMFVVDYIQQNLYFYENAILNGVKNVGRVSGVLEGKMTKFFIPKKEPLLNEIEHFVDCVKNDKEPLINGEDGLKALELAHKLIDSAK